MYFTCEIIKKKLSKFINQENIFLMKKRDSEQYFVVVEKKKQQTNILY
jgi:hypothetical protein